MTRGLGAILVGGKASRMGGVPKGLLLAPSGETVIARTAGLLAAAGLHVVLVGDRIEYATLGHPCLPDDPRALGPLSGLLAALAHAGERPVTVVACDMPFVDARLIEMLVTRSSTSPIVAARREDRLEPLFARYDPGRVLPVAVDHARAGDHSLQRLLRAAGVEWIDVDGEEARRLDDWDTPEDVARGR